MNNLNTIVRNTRECGHFAGNTRKQNDAYFEFFGGAEKAASSEFQGRHVPRMVTAISEWSKRQRVLLGATLLGHSGAAQGFSVGGNAWRTKIKS